MKRKNKKKQKKTQQQYYAEVNEYGEKFGRIEEHRGDFMRYYSMLDEACCLNLGISLDGVNEYIKRLEKNGGSMLKSNLLPDLIRCKCINERINAAGKNLKKSDDVAKADIKLVKKLAYSVKKAKDPFSKCLRQIYGKKKNRIPIAAVIVILIIVIIAAVAAMKLL